MRNASESISGASEELMRPTFVAPRSLVEEFRRLASRRDRTLSAELRKLMRDEIERDKEQTA